LLGVIISITMQVQASQARERERSQELVEERFYRLADAFRKLVAKIRARDGMFQLKVGRDALAVIAAEVRNQLLNPTTTPVGLNAAQTTVKNVPAAFDEIFRTTYSTLGRHLPMGSDRSRKWNEEGCSTERSRHPYRQPKD
jgi:hypothetical protein